MEDILYYTEMKKKLYYIITDANYKFSPIMILSMGTLNLGQLREHNFSLIYSML